MATKLITYQAQLSLAASLARVRGASSAIERLGGRVEFRPTGTVDMICVRLHLPEPYTPERFFPELPFYLVG